MDAYATIKLVSQVGSVLSSNALARKFDTGFDTTCTYDNSVTNALRCLCCQVAPLPLSYAADIPVSSDPALANVRVSFSNVEHEVTGVG